MLTGGPDTATSLVSETLSAIAGRADVVSTHRRKRLFFSTLFRAPRTVAAATDPDSSTPPAIATFHALSEPGRSALTLLYLRVFPPEELAGILGKTQIELADILHSAREEFSRQSSPAS